MRLILSHTSEGFYSLISQGNFGGPRGVQRVAGSSSISSTLRFNLWVPSGEIWTKGLGTASEGGNHPLHFWIRLFDRTGIENEDDAVGHVCIAGPGSGVCPRLVGSHGSHWFQHHVHWSHPGQSELHKRSRVRGGAKRSWKPPISANKVITPTDITDTVQILGGSYEPTDKVWIYVNNFKKGERQQSLPSPQFPIVQSYVDICLTGCLQIEQGFPESGDFAREFIESTQEWSKYSENDRVNPRRPSFAGVPLASKIDHLLQKHLPKLFTEIQLAPGRWQ